jgi:hypothetical protein
MQEIKKYTDIWHKDACIAMVQVADKLMEQKAAFDEMDHMHIAVLLQIKLLMEKKLIVLKKQYKITLSAAEAIAVVVLQRRYFAKNTTWFGNELLTIHNKIIKQFNV